VDEAIKTESLIKRFGSRVAVDELNLEVAPGQIFGFLGPNGAGKTTTIRMLLGHAKATSGSSRVLGAPVPKGLKTVVRRLGALNENPSFYPTVSGRANLKLLAKTAGDRAAQKRVGALLETVGLADRAKDKVGKYSQGMRQRLGLAAALLHDPDLLILDEPVTGLDPAGIREVRDLLTSLRDQGKTVFLSSHLLSEVEQVSDSVAIMSKARVVWQGKLEELTKSTVQTVRVVVGDTTSAYDSLHARGWKVEAEGEALLVEGPTSEEVAGALAVRGIYPRELSQSRRSLEEVFLELTGQGDAAEHA
jgi:ABC-2 type transport system ATP-binding protein